MAKTNPKIQYGTVLVFKKTVTKAQAEAALKKIYDVVELDYYVAKEPYVNEFNPEWGGPVWYIP